MTTAVTTDVKTAVPDVEVAEPLLHLLDDPQAVDAWLASLGPDVDVGVTEMPALCPLATYLTTANPTAGDMVEVYGDSYTVGDAGYLTEPWVMRFVELVDEEPASYVLAGRAREILASALDPRIPLPPCPYAQDEPEENEVCTCEYCRVWEHH